MDMTPTDFKAKFPEFVNVPDVQIQMCIDESVLVVDLEACPDLSELIQGSYVAHCITKSSSNPGGISDGAGAVASKSVGSVSVSYSIATGSKSISDDWYRSTVYGHNFLRLRNLCFPAVAIAP